MNLPQLKANVHARCMYFIMQILYENKDRYTKFSEIPGSNIMNKEILWLLIDLDFVRWNILDKSDYANPNNKEYALTAKGRYEYLKEAINFQRDN